MINPIYSVSTELHYPRPTHHSFKKSLDQRIPRKIPPELEALIGSHASGMPVVIIMSQNCRLLPVRLPADYGQSYLGLFNVIEADVSLRLFFLTCSPFALLVRQTCIG